MLYRIAEEKDMYTIIQLINEYVNTSVKTLEKYSNFVVCEDSGRIVGVSGIGKASSMLESFSKYNYRTCINWTAVDKEFRGQGIAEELIRQVIKRFDEPNIICEGLMLFKPNVANLHTPLLNNDFKFVELEVGHYERLGYCSTCSYVDSKPCVNCGISIYEYNRQ